MLYLLVEFAPDRQSRAVNAAVESVPDGRVGHLVAFPAALFQVLDEFLGSGGHHATPLHFATLILNLRSGLPVQGQGGTVDTTANVVIYRLVRYLDYFPTTFVKESARFGVL